jgi:hypothetical protein
MTPKPYGPVWKTIPIGINHKLEKEIKSLDPCNTDLKFIEPLSQKMYRLDPDAFDIIQKPVFAISAFPQTVQLVITSLRSLGLPDGTCYQDIFAAAKNAGLHLCPAETGLQLRLHYMDQPYAETLVIAMQPLEDNDGLPCVFTVHHWDWGMALGATCCGISNVEDEWHADSDWVFMIN